MVSNGAKQNRDDSPESRSLLSALNRFFFGIITSSGVESIAFHQEGHIRTLIEQLAGISAGGLHSKLPHEYQ